MFYLQGAFASVDHAAQSRARQASNTANEARTDLLELTRKVERLTLLSQAMWELLREKAKLTDADLERLAQEIDLRDGRADGRITATAVRCPSCSRVNNSRHKKCIYCMTEFESMVFE